MRTVLLFLTAIIAYGCGSVNGAIIAARYFFHRDVRDYGSGNAGLTNYYRTFGVIGIIVLILIDVLKSVIAVLIGGALLKISGIKEIGQLFAGFCLILGHVFPIFHHFRCGKGVLCGVTMALLVDWRVGLCCLIAFVIIVVFTRYVSLGSVAAAVLCPIFMWIFGHSGLAGVIALLCALIIVVKHAENIVRLIGGTESKLQLGGRRNYSDEDFED